MVKLSGFANINFSMLKSILSQNGWKIKDNSWMVFTPSKKYLLLPSSLETDDAHLLLERLILTLEELNQSYLLYEAISNFKGIEDIIKIASEVLAPPGLIKLRRAERYYKDLNSVISSSYRAERKKSYFGCSKKRHDPEFLDSIHAGKTGPGSYAVDVHFELSNSPSPPLGRRTAMRVHLALGHLEVFEEDPHKVISMDLYEKLYTSRLCQSLAAMIEGSAISSIKSLAEINPARKDLLNFMTRDYYISEFSPESIVEQISRVVALAEGIPESDQVEVSGFVHTLRDPSQADSSESHQIRIRWSRPKSDPINVSVNLNAEEYRNAIFAHANRREVRLKGYLIRRGTHYFLEDAINFELHD